MKKIIIAVALLFSTIGFAQSKSDLRTRGSYVIKYAAEQTRKGFFENEAKAYAARKLNAIKPIFILNEDELNKIETLFQGQYETFSETALNYKNNGTEKSKLDLISAIVTNEEEFRELLTKDQIAKYIEYGNEHAKASSVEYMAFQDNFLSQKQLESFKKELQ